MDPEAGNKNALYSCYKLLQLSVCFYCAEQKQKDFGGRASGEVFPGFPLLV